MTSEELFNMALSMFSSLIIQNDQKMKSEKERLENDCEKAIKNCEYFKKAHAEN